MTVGAPVFSVRNLAVRYGALNALAKVSADLSRGRITALVGPSGCGKSTFLGCLNRMTELLDDCHVQGSVLLDGEDIASMSAPALRRRVGLIFQRPNPFPTSIRHNVQLALREHGVRSRAELDRITLRVLEDVGLLNEVRPRLDAPAASLSGGQQQRLCIARAIALEPEVLLMDEP